LKFNPPRNDTHANLLIIDPQNDFCDIEGVALPVASANEDLDLVEHRHEACELQWSALGQALRLAGQDHLRR
jgi:nicotinamidase-related amidase